MNGESEVNLSLPPGLGCLLETSGVYKKYPEVRFFPAYVPGEPDVLGAGLSKLVRFRLFNPAAAVVFLSFIDKNVLDTKDTFGVLEVPGTFFLQLPCYKDDLLTIAGRVGNCEDKEKKQQWESFAQKACTFLIREHIRLLEHGHKNHIGNILYPLRASSVGIVYTPELQSQYVDVTKKHIDRLKDFLNDPQIKDLIQLLNVNNDAKDKYLEQASSFSENLLKLSCWTNYEEDNVRDLIDLIDNTNSIYDKLKSQ
ncbi:MAG: hypothetical protein WC446_07840 [Candidatus Paceibacterota bacterium]|jgi:hypothetical protein